MSRNPISSLAQLALAWASPAMERPVYWRALAGGDRWVLLLITKGRESEPPIRPDREPAPRLTQEWARRSGLDLGPEGLLYGRILRRLQAYAQGGSQVDTALAVALAVDAVVDAIRDGELDVERLRSEAPQ